MGTIITERKIREIVKEEIKKLLAEGIDFPKSRTVSVNNNHQNYVDTNDYYNPYLFTDNQRGYRTISIFQRKSTIDRIDSNPLLNALKQRKGWEFNNAKEDLHKLLKNFVSAAKLLPKYDTIIMIPSHNQLNEIVFGYLIRLIPHSYYIKDFFQKMTANEVYNCMIDDEYIDNNFGEMAKKVYADIDDAFIEMDKSNDGIFSYKYLQKAKYREAIMQSLKINKYPHCELNYANEINGKDILVFDDTITTGKTISDSGKAIKEMFNPKSITYVTLFSAIANDENNTQEKVSSI